MKSVGLNPQGNAAGSSSGGTAGGLRDWWYFTPSLRRLTILASPAR